MKLWQIIRRRYYFYFKRDKILKSIKQRKGNCTNCGLCCSKSIFGFKCKQFDEKTNSCKVYNTPEMPLLCYYYPFDEKDKWDFTKQECGYWWD